MKPAPYTLSPEIVADYQRDGAVCIRGAFKGWVDTIAAGIERNLREKSATAVDIAGGKGSFFDDYCNWERIPEFVQVVRESFLVRKANSVDPTKEGRGDGGRQLG